MAEEKDGPAGQDQSQEGRSKADDTFFHYYGLLSHQQNMLQDYVRTGTYNSAIVSNPSDFRDKVVLDVGTGACACPCCAPPATAE